MTANQEQAASYSVLVDGVEIDQEQKDRLKEVRVVDYLRLPDVCTLAITYPRGEGIDSHPFEIGSALEVRLGAADELAPQTLFRGQIVTLEPEFGSGGCSVLVRAYDRSHLLHRSRRVRTFQNQTPSDIVESIVGEAGLTPECEASPIVHDFVQQDNETDWDFIWRLAERIGFEFVVEDTIAHFRRPTAERALELEWPGALRSFRPRVTAVQQVQEVTLLAHDPKTKQPIEASAGSPDQIAEIGMGRDTVTGAFEGASVHVATEPVKTQTEANALAQALLDKLANGYIGAEGTAAGDPRIKAGTSVRVSGVGSRFSGIYRIATSIHVLRGGGAYETHFANAPSNTMLGAVGSNGNAVPYFGSQLVLGVVTNNRDPDGMGRVRVRYPALGSSAEGAWARIATPSAGKDRGLLMLPVVGEEVLIGFEHDDTTRPYVLGSLFSGKDTPGADLLQDEDGSFALKSGTKVYTESKGDYTVKSGAKLVVDVARDWTAEAKGRASLKASQPFEIDGQSVTISGTAVLELKCGAASIKLSSGGVTISGPSVSIG
jgi:uncharacterized protein involved in type VI secretion and phage assembly